MAIKQVAQRETVEVFLSDRRVVASDAQSVIPKGYRQATLDEVALRYTHDAGFRKELWIKGAVLTSQKGLCHSGPNQINEDGTFSKMDMGPFFFLSPEKRSYHWPGSGSVAVGVVVDEYLGGGKRLGVVADLKPSFWALVAYVKDDRSGFAKLIGRLKRE